MMKLCCCICAVFALLTLDVNAEESPSPEQIRFFESKVRPLLAEHCWKCHGEDKQKGELRLDSLAAMLAGGESGDAIVPQKPEKSLLMEAVRYESLEMPPKAKLKDDQIAIFEAWIKMGAPWPGADDAPPVRKSNKPKFSEEDLRWWAVQPVVEPAVPHVDIKDANDQWSRNEIDRFILRRLQENRLAPAGEADRPALIRRLYFDLLGVPPAPAEVDAFVADSDPDAYEKLVDRLLEDPRYGERWARHWLDLVRYADSDGYRADGYRPNAWRYRDYVIRSLNEDKPYDRFMQEQIAGDELFPDNPEALIATGFLRHGIYEYNSRDALGQLNIMLNELTDTTGDVFLGLGMQCARCHDHKFDPILQRDYFRLRAFFEPIQFVDRTAATAAQIKQHDDALKEWSAKSKQVREDLAELESPYRKKAEKVAVIKFPVDVQAMYNKPASERTPREQQLSHFVWRQVEYEYSRLDNLFKPEDKEKILELRRKLATFDKQKPQPLPVAEVAVDVGPKSPATVIPKRKTEVQPGALTLIEEEPFAIPDSTIDSQSTGRRTTLANWLADERNPLSTRVIVNRVWQFHFGRGLAPNSSDFGLLGGPPSHPELLDWLTVRFIQGDWKLKNLHRLIVTSATYRQSTAHKDFDQFMIVDPLNQWYWRADTRRLDAEQVRDAILTVSGQLKPKSGGEGVRPDQPYRSIYTQVRRNSRDPLLDVFDLPQFFTSSSSRDTTTTPIQSLLLINSQTMLLHASNLAKRASGQSESIDQSIRNLWRLTLGREPATDEIADARAFVESQAELLRQQRKEKKSTEVALEGFKTGKFPYRDGQSVIFDPKKPKPFAVADDDRLDLNEFTIEAFFQVSSVYESGSVRTIAAKWNGSHKTPGWAFGVTGKGSRRKPQTVVIQLFGKKADSPVAEAAIFSDQHVELNTPYYVAATVRMAGDQPGEVTFYLKDLSNDDDPISVARRPHDINGAIENNLPVSIGKRDKSNGLFDGLIDDVRISRGVLDDGELLYADESPGEKTVGYWQFEPAPGILHDSGPNGLFIQTVDAPGGSTDENWLALVDLCHVLMNSSEFLYVH